MKKIIPLPFLLAATLVACGKPDPAETSKPAPTETVEALAANPARLKELREQCKTDRAKVGDELCNRAAEATNRRFFGDGKTPYTPPKEQPKF
ncbi:MAG: EexN family lipoprotein [Proteobacteria bacterium]|nr:EexN family lipoprotein [Pseudomonadota bacterium]HQR04661.1 EexN family lipoprotein [Rhodocyclaceae bacterium]